MPLQPSAAGVCPSGLDPASARARLLLAPPYQTGQQLALSSLPVPNLLSVGHTKPLGAWPVLLALSCDQGPFGTQGAVSTTWHDEEPAGTLGKYNTSDGLSNRNK